MAGETVRTEATCLAVRRWSRTSHIVTWLTQAGRVVTVARGAERPKSFLLGQYDLNYDCEIVYYAHSKGEVHALRECAPIERRDALRSNWRQLAVAEYVRSLAGELAPGGADAMEWLRLVRATLDDLALGGEPLAILLEFDLGALRLAGIGPDFRRPSGMDAPFYLDTGSFSTVGTRSMRVSDDVVACLNSPGSAKNRKILLDAARVISVFYSFHLDCAPETRRTVLSLIS